MKLAGKYMELEIMLSEENQAQKKQILCLLSHV